MSDFSFGAAHVQDEPRRHSKIREKKVSSLLVFSQEDLRNNSIPKNQWQDNLSIRSNRHKRLKHIKYVKINESNNNIKKQKYIDQLGESRISTHYET